VARRSPVSRAARRTDTPELISRAVVIGEICNSRPQNPASLDGYIMSAIPGSL
jgi:hypothetical protein